MVASRIAEITICCAVEYCVPRKTGREGAMADRLRPIGQYEWHLHVPSAGLVWKRPRAGGGESEKPNIRCLREVRHGKILCCDLLLIPVFMNERHGAISINPLNLQCQMIRSEWGRELASENDQETERGPDEQLNSTQFGICANLRLCGTGVWFEVYVVVQATPR
ncbi:hypothetical protein PoMZ_02638 [Pyricularia oryzae]|uniref:Uncharacterized protein n=1 Tax=Pyricularia oryzae TaxID=318829 RepID=A0A4P7N5S9_PYROR|nr:hypothetical protein PoMZ_02638 [Pyricularia oryzae]